MFDWTSCFSTSFPFPELENLEVPPLSPTSKEVLSQAVKASFSGFSQERVNHDFPLGRATHLTLTRQVIISSYSFNYGWF